MNHFSTINRRIGWAMGALAATVYTLTVAPTASFWDCGEYIAAAHKLQVPHPPGAPLFLLLGRLFSLLAGADATRVAFWVNMSSAVASACTVMVVFWIITLLGRKALQKRAAALTGPEQQHLWAAGIVGSLSLTFCDTFWCNATEAETYASSTLMVVLVIWAMLNWELTTDRQQGYRWLMLVAYLLGLSTGLRIFSLLTLPGLCLLFYFKHSNRTTLLGAAQALLVGGLLIAFVYAGIVPGLPTLAFWTDWLFVNHCGLPFGSGVLVALLVVVGSLAGGLAYAISRRHQGAQAALLCLTLLLIGYSSHALEVVRARAQPPINENNPSTVVNLIGYLQRAQYGHKPLLYGPHFAAPVIGQKRGAPAYRPVGSRYQVVGHKPQNVFDPEAYMLLPRLWSRSPAQAAAYRRLLHLTPEQLPTWQHNAWFLLKHQLWERYLRYLLWNFAGRASDEQDAAWCSPQDAFRQVPHTIAHNAGRCNYWLLPLLLGLLGAAFQASTDRKSFSALLVHFLMLGVAFLLFWNPPPVEPRARDYFYVNSFVIFTIWIGLGTLAAVRWRRTAIVGCLIVPALMGAQGWKRHDRSGNYLCTDMAKNLLNTCAPNAILFTGGDNDTFPLWYVQEVEAFRTDVRVVVLTYANTDWYIQQLRRPVHQSAPLPLSLSAAQYRQHGPNDFLPYVRPPSSGQGPLDAEKYLHLLQADHPIVQVRTATGELNNSVPASRMALANAPGPAMVWELRGRGLEKKDLLLLDLLVTNRWERPIYFNPTSLNNLNIRLNDYVVYEGAALRLRPTRGAAADTAAMHHQLMHAYRWRGLDDAQVYHDEIQRGFVLNYRLMFNTLAKALLRTGQPARASAVLQHCLTLMPDQAIPYDAANACMVGPLLAAGEQETALALAHTLCQRTAALLTHYPYPKRDTTRHLATLHQVAHALHQAGHTALAQQYHAIFQKHHQRLHSGEDL